MTRDAIVAEALSWKKTPWHHQARKKGVGVDCAQFLIAVYALAGLIPELDPGYYPPDWHLHQEEPKFLAILRNYADKVDEALPGDVAMFKYGRHAAHGSIVIRWPVIVHAYIGEACVVESNAQTNLQLAKRFDSFWRLKGLEAQESAPHGGLS